MNEVGRDKLKLTDAALAMLLTERNIEAQSLRAQAERLENMTLDQYLRRGLDLHAVSSFELAGRMARAGFQRVFWSTSDGGWRAHYEHSEGPIGAVDIESMLCSSPLASDATKTGGTHG